MITSKLNHGLIIEEIRYLLFLQKILVEKSRLFAKIAFELGILYFFAKRCGIHFGTTYRFAFQLALKMGSIALLVWCMGYWVNTTVFAKMALQIALLVLGWGWLLRKTYAEAI